MRERALLATGLSLGLLFEACGGNSAPSPKKAAARPAVIQETQKLGLLNSQPVFYSGHLALRYNISHCRVDSLAAAQPPPVSTLESAVATLNAVEGVLSVTGAICPAVKGLKDAGTHFITDSSGDLSGSVDLDVAGINPGKTATATFNFPYQPQPVPSAH